MGMLSILFDKMMKAPKKEVFEEDPKQPVVEIPKKLTQEEKDDAFLWALCELDQKKALEMLASGVNPNYEQTHMLNAILHYLYHVAHNLD